MKKKARLVLTISLKGVYQQFALVKANQCASVFRNCILLVCYLVTLYKPSIHGKTHSHMKRDYKMMLLVSLQKE